MVWLAAGVGVAAVLAIAIWVQQRHEDSVLKLLLPLCGERLEMAIAPAASKFVVIGEYVGVIDAIDPSTRWVTFVWIDFSDDQQQVVGAIPSDRLATNGVSAACIRWVQRADGSRINLT